MDKIWDRKSKVIGRCGGDEKNEWPRRTDKSRTLQNEKNNKYNWDIKQQIRHCIQQENLNN